LSLKVAQNQIKWSKADEYVEYRGFPLFSIFELNITPYCTRHCDYCPRGHGYTDSGNSMVLEDASKIVDELADIYFRGLLVISGMGEPLLHPYWDAFSEIITNGYWKTQLITNGDLLENSSQVKSFDFVSISLNQPNEQKFIGMLEGKVDYEIRQRYLGDFSAKTNRAGYLGGAGNSDRPCNYPMYHMLINHDGRAFSCCHDWTNTFSLGNVFKDGIFKVWTGDNYHEFREMLFNNRSLDPCWSCDADGMMSGEKHRQGWQKVYRKGKK